jgi:indolepyruvate ferredoxin oxidoreductase beta subunit
MNILISGVGGQGALLAAKIIGAAAMKRGYDVKVSEIHGMSQRGGSVETYAQYSKTPVNAPIFGKGEADIVLGLEALESLRGAAFLKKGGFVIANTQRINPMPVITGAAEYPTGIAEKIEGLGVKVHTVDAFKAAEAAGSVKAVNVVMLGAMSALLGDGFTYEDWVESVKECVPPKFVEMNLKAFDEGRKLFG